MDWVQVVSGAVASLVTVAILARVESVGASRALATEDGHTLTHGLLFVVFMWFGLAFFVVLLGFAIVEQNPAYIAIASVFVLGTLAAVLEGRSRVVWDEKGIRDYKPWRGGREVEWPAIVQISSSAVNSWYVLRDREGRVFRVSHYMQGAADFIRYAVQACPEAFVEHALRAALDRED